MKKQIILFIIAGMLWGAGCDIIKEENRLIPIISKSVDEKKVLLFEFTDQNCANCPNATAETNKLKERFSDTIVVVSIHASPFPFQLRTSEGNEYEQHFQAEGHPTGIVDGGVEGKFMSHDPQVWGGFIIERLQTEPAVNIGLNAIFDEITNEVCINVLLNGKQVLPDVRLLLWIIENNIQQWQLMPDGTRNDSYIHNHVFRVPINGIWGESLSIGTNEAKDFNYTFTLNSTWKPEDISIVGFVYEPDTDETFNVQEISLINKKE